MVSWQMIVLFHFFLFQMQRNTTPMYRAPEMVDLYSNYPITVKSDIWVSASDQDDFSVCARNPFL
jgi:hypothetical protein